VYSAVVGSAASEAASELAASLDAAEDATEEEAAVEEELPQAVMPTASARAAATIATFLSFMRNTPLIFFRSSHFNPTNQMGGLLRLIIRKIRQKIKSYVGIFHDEAGTVTILT
jgi:hypothetical protein